MKFSFSRLSADGPRIFAVLILIRGLESRVLLSIEFSRGVGEFKFLSKILPGCEKGEKKKEQENDTFSWRARAHRPSMFLLRTSRYFDKRLSFRLLLQIFAIFCRGTQSIYNIWYFLGNLTATLVINITFRRAKQPTSGEIPFEFMPVVRISGFIRSSWREKFANVHHRGGEKS